MEDVDVQCGGEVKEVEDVEDVDVEAAPDRDHVYLYRYCIEFLFCCEKKTCTASQ